MKILSLLAAADPGGLLEIKKAINEALEELNVESEEANLFITGLPCFDGVTAEAMKPLAKSIGDADGIIFYINSYYSLPGSLIEVFFEHISAPEYGDVLRNKNCFILVNGVNAPPGPAINSVAAALNMAGAFDSVRLGIDASFAQGFEPDTENRLMVERALEDFYRMLRQQRKFYISAAPPGETASRPPSSVPKKQPARTKAKSPEVAKIQKLEAEKIISKIDEGNFSAEQQKDIQEITKFFAEKFKTAEAVPQKSSASPQTVLSPLLPNLPREVAPKSCLQLSSSLAHFFNGPKAEGLDADIQLIVTGDEEFEAYYSINGKTCRFTQGECDKPDITIISSPHVWKDVLKGKISAQKAFMTGQIKVRGNFVLLSKFDQVFTFNIS